MTLTVLSIAFPFAPVGPDAVGGAEQILSALDAALISAGQRSIVVACEGSVTAGDQIAVPVPKGKFDGECRCSTTARMQTAIDHAIELYRVDIVHMHGLDFFEYVIPGDVPLLVTLHLPISWYPERAWRANHTRTHFVCVSEEQRANWQWGRDAISVIENGVQLSPYREKVRQALAIVMGRICPEKNAHEALEAATRCRTPVYIVGQVFPYADHERYFAQQISPWLGEPKAGHRFLGPLSREQRQQLLSSARCLLHPTRAPETSSLAAMEALAAGTPVIAYRSGALTSIVEHGVTGLLVGDPSGMTEAITHVDRIRNVDCRRAAERRFSQDRMIAEYFNLYEQLVHESRAEQHCA